ncbi:MAG: T9SS type A sorting domain-containing protein [Candidatus Cloacimonetes bacterium]|nr:T9SS type A sorting domain-containing protein [Candidatus Cloacimonadota bacterium]
MKLKVYRKDAVLLHKVSIICLFCLFCSLLNSTTWHIKQDGTGNFTTIQEGIDAAANTDTILVYPGTYYENLIMTEKNITLASLEMTTGDPQYINSTIIDGQRLESCIFLHDVDDEVLIQGFTIQNGYGTYLTGNDGGGIQAVYIENGLIKNCYLKQNIGLKGGAFYTALSNLTFSGLRVTENSASLGGGAYWDNQSIITFDPDNLCDIYNNNAGKGADLFSNYSVTTHVVVDTFTVLNPDRYFAEYDMDASYTFNIQNNWMELVSQDLYVAPDGDDANSGLYVTDPLKNISWAVRKIQPDNLNPLTIHVAAGTYSWEENQQIYPIGSKAYLSIVGDDMYSTILNNDCAPCTYMGWNIIGNLTFSNFTLNNCLVHTMSHIIYLREISFMNMSNIIIDGNENFKWNIISEFVENVYDNVNITNNTGIAYSGITMGKNKGIIKNSAIQNNSLVDNPLYNGAISALCLDAYDNFHIENTIISGNTSTDETCTTIALGAQPNSDDFIVLSNCLITDNVSTKDYMINLNTEGGTYLNNVTISDNISANSTIRSSHDLTLRNTIMHNNTNYEIFMRDIGIISELDIDYCNIKNGINGIYNQNNANIIDYGVNNMSEYPLFDSLGTYPYALLSGSPCIDTGTPDTTGLFLPPWDLIYNQRVWDGNNNGEAIIDMGCYEFGADSVGVSQNLIPNILNHLTNYPNPFNPSTSIQFSIQNDSKVELTIYNIKGQKVKTLYSGIAKEGKHSIIWNGKDTNNKLVSSGIYFYKLKTNNKELTHKMLMMK